MIKNPQMKEPTRYSSRISSVGLLLTPILCFFFLSCASTKKKDSTPILSELEGKKIALVSVDGEPTPRKIVEVALINQLVKRGTFILISKQDVEAARVNPHQDSTDLTGIAKRAGAEYALEAIVKRFDAKVNEGYTKEIIEDSQLAEEQGTDGKTERLIKVKSLEGRVEVLLRFTRVTDSEIKSGLADATDRVEENDRTGAIHLPPELRFLENIANKAFRDFFDRYN